MNDKPEVPGSGEERARTGEDTSAIPPDGTPTVNIGGSYGSSSTPYSTSPMPGAAPETPGMPARDPYSSQPGQYSSGGDAPGSGAGNYGSHASQGQGQPAHYNPPPQYNPSQYGQGQPTQYTPPPGGYPQQPNPQQPYNHQQPYNPQYPQQYPPQYGYAQPKDPTVGLLLELLGYIGFLGIGHIWAGKTTRGVAMLVGYWIYLTLSWILVIVLVGCLMLLASLAIPLISGFYLKSEMEREQAAMGIRR
jgi:hypothetical protein